MCASFFLVAVLFGWVWGDVDFCDTELKISGHKYVWWHACYCEHRTHKYPNINRSVVIKKKNRWLLQLCIILFTPFFFFFFVKFINSRSEIMFFCFVVVSVTYTLCMYYLHIIIALGKFYEMDRAFEFLSYHLGQTQRAHDIPENQILMYTFEHLKTD